MELDRIVAELKSEQARIGRAINALLEGVGLTSLIPRSPREAAAPKRRRGMSPAGRKRQAAAMRAYWAARRAKSAAPKSNKAIAVAKPTTRKKRGGGLTPAGRKRLSEMMKKRWAERRMKTS